jgi:hypothetical protein
MRACRDPQAPEEFVRPDSEALPLPPRVEKSGNPDRRPNFDQLKVCTFRYLGWVGWLGFPDGAGEAGDEEGGEGPGEES